MLPHYRHLGKIVFGWPGIGVITALFYCLGGAAAAPYGGGTDPVEDLRQALRAPVDPKIKEDLEFRKTELEKRIKALRKAQYGRALALEEWKDQDKELEIAAIDAPIRKGLVAAFKDFMVEILDQKIPGQDALRLAALGALGEMGIKVRGEALDVPLARELAPSIIPLLTDAVPAIRQTAARTLGKIGPDPKVAAPALGKLLGSPNADDRRAAAEGLKQMLATMVPQLKARSHIGARVAREDVVQLASLVTDAIGPGLQDREGDIKKISLETIQLAGYLFGEEVRDLPTESFPPPGRKLTAEDQKKIKEYQERVTAEIKEFQPLSEALDKQAGNVAQALNDPRIEIRLLAANTLVQIAFAQEQLLRRAASVPRLELKKEGEGAAAALDQELELLLVALVQAKVAPESGMMKEALPQLIRAIRDPDARVRLAALEALHMLGRRAVSAAPAVLQAVEDGNQFVRWVAVRFLGRYGPPEQREEIVRALIPRLTDLDLDVQLATAAALGTLGRQAAAAAPALSSQIQFGDARIFRYLRHQPPAHGTAHQPEEFGDAEMRLAHMRALQTTGAADQEALHLAVQALISALQNRDSRVRIAAAEALGQFGPAARDAIPALKVALEDRDPDPDKRNLVRQAVSNALLALAGDQ